MHLGGPVTAHRDERIVDRIDPEVDPGLELTEDACLDLSFCDPQSLLKGEVQTLDMMQEDVSSRRRTLKFFGSAIGSKW